MSKEEKERIEHFFKNMNIKVIKSSEKRIEGIVFAEEIYDISWSEHEPFFSELLCKTIQKEVKKKNVCSFFWEGNRANKTIEFDIYLFNIK